ncbi:MAG: T9SS type A sorting domain-containing protein [Ferruginibacter sp.]
MKPTSTRKLCGHPFGLNNSKFSPTLRVLSITIFLFTSFYLAEAGDINGNKEVPAVNSLAANAPLTGTESMRTNLYLLNISDNSTILADGVLTEYNTLYHDYVTLEDAYKFTNIKENLGITRYTSTLAVERRPIIASADTIFFKLWKTTQRHYQFEFVPTNLFHPGMDAILQDSYLGTSTVLSLVNTTKVNFFVNSNAASGAVDRFKIIYSTNSTTTPLPVTFTNIKGYQVNNKISIEWKVETEINIARYEVERSLTGSDFSKVNTIYVTGINNASNSYTSLDESPATGNNFYRIKSIDKDGSKKYSLIVKVVTGKTGTGSITIYPNPIKGSIINLQFTNQLTGIYQVRLINNNGQMVYSNRLSINSSNISQSLNTNKELRSGIYQIEIIKPDNTIEIQKAIVQP